MNKLLKLSIILLVSLSALLLVSCHNDKKEPVNPDNNKTQKYPDGVDPTSKYFVNFSDQYKKKVNLKVWFDDPDGKYFKALTETMKNKYPDIILTTQNVGSVDSLAQLKILGPVGAGPDVFKVPHDNVAKAVSEGLALPLDGDIIDLLNTNALEKAKKLAIYTYKGKQQIYGVPQSIEATGLYVNENLAESKGITPDQYPTTFEEIVSSSTLYNGQNQDSVYFSFDQGYTNAYAVQPIFSATGFTPFGPNGNDATNIGFDSEGFKNGLNWFRTNKKALTIEADGSIRNKYTFEAGKVAFTFQGPWAYNSWKNFKFKRLPLPTLKGNVAKPFLGGQIAMIYKNSKNIDAAKSLLKVLLSKEGAADLIASQTKLPAIKTDLLEQSIVLATEIAKKYQITTFGDNDKELLKAMSKDINEGNVIPMPNIKEIAYFWTPETAALQELFSTQTPIDTIAAKALENFNQSVAQSNA